MCLTLLAAVRGKDRAWSHSGATGNYEVWREAGLAWLSVRLLAYGVVDANSYKEELPLAGPT
ncbi:uncharacterized protein TrAFT101_000619 [Trichoderma asperellum]|uniref:uncharacterized protein n=1 Tax=Trichoderma asperellum TaxID=101201 RepID=UPI0033283B2B|nr:hypothetical protein TrAFT101_000619 [Trichoderma asperellum]